MLSPESIVARALDAGCPRDQVENNVRAGIMLQPRQLAASAAARLCDLPDGPTAIGYGGARGGGKSHWLLAQIGADDCQRYPGLKVLLLRKSAKTNKEAFDDLRKRLFANLPHKYNASTGTLEFQNGSRIIAKHYQHENEINNSYLGVEYDVIAIEEATTLTARKWEDIQTCCRSSKPNWRPRIYSTTNPGGVGHEWYRAAFILPFERGQETTTRFIPALSTDNKFTNPEYQAVLDNLTGARRPMWRDGNWNVAAGQFFSTFDYKVHVLPEFRDLDAVDWLAAMDYGYTHYTVFLLGCLDANDNLIIVDEHAERGWIPQRHVRAIKDMLVRHRLVTGESAYRHGNSGLPYSWRLSHIAVGGDVFAHQYDGSTIKDHFRSLGSTLFPANTHRTLGWAEVLARLGDPAAGIPPKLFIHQRCRRLIDTLPYLQHDPDQPADVLKSNTNEEGLGGDDSADTLRYLVASKVPRIYATRLRGL